MAKGRLIWWTIAVCIAAGCGDTSGGASGGAAKGFSSHGITVRYPSDWSSEDGVGRDRSIPTPITGQVDWGHSFYAPDGSVAAAIVTGQQPILVTQGSLLVMSRIVAQAPDVPGSVEPTSFDGRPALTLDGPYMSGDVSTSLHSVIVYQRTASFGFVCLAKVGSSDAKEECAKFAASFEVHPLGSAAAAWSNLKSPNHALTVSVPPHWVPRSGTPQLHRSESIAADYKSSGGFTMGVFVAGEPFHQPISIPLYVRAATLQFHQRYGFRRLRLTKLDPWIGKGVWLLVGSKTNAAAIYIEKRGRTLLTLIHPYDPKHAYAETALRPTYDAIAATMRANH
ncbi:MAG: hypothetical protein ACHQEA_12480 [Gaiellales bacterium]